MEAMEQIITTFGPDLSSSVHLDNKGKGIIILGKGPTQALEDTTLTAEAKYSIIFIQSGKRFLWSLHYNGSNSLLFVNAAELYQYKAKISETKDYALCLSNVSKDFAINYMKKKKKNRIKRSYKIFFLLILITLILRTWYKIMFGFIKGIFIGLLTGRVNGYNHTNCFFP